MQRKFSLYSTSAIAVQSSQPKSYWQLVFVAIPLWAIIGNLLIIFSVLIERKLRTVNNYFLVNLAIADLLVGCVDMPFFIYLSVNNGSWFLGHRLCDIYLSFEITCCAASVLNLLAISISRYMAVTSPMQFRAKIESRKRFMVVAAVIWFLAIAVGFPLAFGANDDVHRRAQHCTYNNVDYNIFASFLFFWLPCAVIVLIYVRIFFEIRARKLKLKSMQGAPTEATLAKRRKQRSLKEEKEEKGESKEGSEKGESDKNNDKMRNKIDDKSMSDSSTQSLNKSDIKKPESDADAEDAKSENSSPKESTTDDTTKTSDTEKPQRALFRKMSRRFNRERKATVTIAIVLTSFLLCWLPFFSFVMYYSFCVKITNNYKCPPGMIAFYSASWLAYCNSCVNCLIYASFNPKFRQTYKRIIFCKFC